MPCQASNDDWPKLPMLNPDRHDSTAMAFTAETGSYMYMCPEVTAVTGEAAKAQSHTMLNSTDATPDDSTVWMPCMHS